MKKTILYLILAALLIVMIGCGKEDNLSKVDEGELSCFSVGIDGNYVSIGDRQVDLELESLFGALDSQEVEEVGPGGDTFAGSYKKKLKFTGVELTFFAPEDDEEKYWLINIIVLDSKYQTPRGISIEDTLEELKEAYPEAVRHKDGRTDDRNFAYQIVDETSYDYLRFEIRDGYIERISLFRLLP